MLFITPKDSPRTVEQTNFVSALQFFCLLCNPTHAPAACRVVNVRGSTQNLRRWWGYKILFCFWRTLHTSRGLA